MNEADFFTKIPPAPRDMQADKPWMWANKTALRRIREHIAEADSALAVYFALCEIASDNETEEVRTTHEHIRDKCRLSVATIKRRLDELEHEGLLCIKRERLRAPSTYLLAHVSKG